jgi:hypothetical protein
MMHCSMSLLCCFLGRFLPKLGGASASPFFSPKRGACLLCCRPHPCRDLRDRGATASSSGLDIGPAHATLQHGCDGAIALGVFSAAFVLALCFRLCLPSTGERLLRVFHPSHAVPHQGHRQFYATQSSLATGRRDHQEPTPPCRGAFQDQKERFRLTCVKERFSSRRDIYCMPAGHEGTVCHGGIGKDQRGSHEKPVPTHPDH